MKLKNVKFGTKCILKSDQCFGRFSAGMEVTIHVTKPTPSGNIGVITVGGQGHHFLGVLNPKYIPPIPEGFTGFWVKPEELKRVKDSK